MNMKKIAATPTHNIKFTFSFTWIARSLTFQYKKNQKESGEIEFPQRIFFFGLMAKLN